MKNYYTSIFLCFFILIGLPVDAQKTLQPTSTKALVSFVFTNPLNQQLVPHKVFQLEGLKSKQTFDLKTNKKGKAEVLVPTNEEYVIHLPNWKNFANISIPKEPYQRHNIPVPFYEIPKEGSDIIIKIPVQLRLIKANGLPSELEEEITIKSGKTKKIYHIKTCNHGTADFELPINDAYVLSLPNAPFYYKFEIPNKPYAAWKEDIVFERKAGMQKYPSIKNALFNFIFEDMENKRCAGEKFWLKSTTTNQKYEGTTNSMGIAQILVPINDNYILNAVGNLNFDTKQVLLQEGNDLIVETVLYQSPSTAQQQARKEAQNKAAAQRDSIAKIEAQKLLAKIDSLDNLNENKALKDWAKRDLPIPVEKKTFRIRKAVVAKVEIYEKQLKVNPHFFEDNDKPILATLQRFKDQWKGKVVVTDVTQSMNPYLEEVLIWHVLNLQKGERTKYLFFNDGDKKMASAKKIGKTGGIYDCIGIYEDLPVVIQTMQTAIHNSLGGGEPPENDLEAVLKAVENKKEIEEVILIADAYSRVRDMDLLSQITVPIHIILCGAEETNDYYKGIKSDINEQYLTIAHRTSGSLHTLKHDIWNLSAKKEGEVVQIGQSRYILKNRQFIQLP